LKEETVEDLRLKVESWELAVDDGRQKLEDWKVGRLEWTVDQLLLSVHNYGPPFFGYAGAADVLTVSE
jgi:hypothetical protein